MTPKEKAIKNMARLQKKLDQMSHKERLDYLGKLIQKIVQVRREKMRKAKGVNAGIKKLAIEKGMIAGHEYWIVESPLKREREKALKEKPDLKNLFDLMPVGYNGYVLFKEKPISDPEYGGILTYVPVHGGITYAHTDELGTVYGFDTAHGSSGDRPIEDLRWIRKQCRVMIKAIKVAEKLEIKYLGERDKRKRAEIAQQVRDVAAGEELSFGVMINLLTGEI